MVAKCPFCGRLYEISPYYPGDQNACPACRDEAKRNSRGKDRWFNRYMQRDLNPEIYWRQYYS